jgi:hypothetical protein
MPFTLSHAVAVIPLFRWRRLDPLALVIGSMAPDFGYFLHRFALAGHAHSLVGSLTVALPSACGAWLALRWLAPFVSLPLPRGFGEAVQQRLSGAPWNWPMLAWVPLSLILGIGSHTLLDAFSHKSGWFVRHLEFLHHPWPVYHALQHLGSFLGMAVLVTIAYREWKRHPPALRFGMEIKLILLGIAIAASMLLAILPSWNFALRFDGFLQIRAFTFRWIVNSIAFASCAYLLLALACQLCRWITAPASPGTTKEPLASTPCRMAGGKRRADSPTTSRPSPDGTGSASPASPHVPSGLPPEETPPTP